MYFVCELSILFVCVFYNRNGVYNDCFDNRKNGVYNCWGESMYTTPPASNNSSHTPATHSQHHKSTLPQQNKFCHNSCYGAQGGPVVIIINLIFNVMIQFNDAVAILRKNGAKSETDLVVKNVTVADRGNWTNIALTLNREVDGPVCDIEGQWAMGKTNVVFISFYNILRTLKNTDETIAITNHIAKNPTSLQIILNGAKIEILQQEVKAHASYIDVFKGEETYYDSDHDSLFNHLISIDFSDKGRKAIERIEDHLLGL